MVRIFEGINVVSISVPDLDAAREFYRDVLDLGEPSTIWLTPDGSSSALDLHQGASL